MTEHEKSRKHYEQSGTYDPNMEYFEECEVNSGAWVLITRQIPVDERCKPHLFGIYWGIPKQDRFDRQVCVVHTTEDVTLLNHEFTVIDDERLKVYREEGWELHENMAAADAGMNTELIEKGRALCEEERETIWAMQLDDLIRTPMRNLQEFLEDDVPDIYDVTQPSVLACIGEKGIRRATVIKDCAYTITTRQDRTPAQVIDRGDGRYRYLTERECWRLMGYSDEDFDRAKAVQERNGKYYKALYDQAGNSIAVPIFESIFRKIILQEVA